LAGITPPWTLTGGGALAGVHLGHRETRDLDLFRRNRGELGSGTAIQVLKGYDPRPAAKALGWSSARTEELLSFRQWLIDRLAAGAAPE
jgi:hypothetical protein